MGLNKVRIKRKYKEKEPDNGRPETNKHAIAEQQINVVEGNEDWEDVLSRFLQYLQSAVLIRTPHASRRRQGGGTC